MSFTVFYAIREMRRKPMRFAATVLMIGAIFFCMTDLILLLESTSTARALAHAGDPTYTEPSRFHSASFLLLLSTHMLLMLAGIAILTDHKLRYDAEEHAVLRDLGVTKGRLMLLHTVENSTAFLIAFSLSLPFSVLMMSHFVLSLNSKLQGQALLFHIPYRALGISSALLFLAELLGSLLPFVLSRSAPIVSPRGKWDPTCAPLRMFHRLCHRRARGKRVSDIAILFVIQILPLIFLIAAFSFRPLPEPPYDCAVHVNQTLKQPIPQSIPEKIGQIEGIRELEVFEHSQKGYYSGIRVKFEEELREAGIAAVSAITENTPYDFIDTYHRAQQASWKNTAHRQLLLLLAAVLFGAALLLLALILLSTLQRHGDSLEILYTLGLPKCEIDRFFRRETLSLLLCSGALAFAIAAVCFAAMETEGGGTLPLTDILAAALVHPILQCLLGALLSHTAQRQFTDRHLRHDHTLGRE